jgi:hypothetical protein
MIICNGKIREKIQTGGGLDEEGNPVSSSESLGEPIPCRIKVNKQNNLGKQNGNTFTIASYEILIESQPFTAERVQLERLEKDLGEYSVISTEYLEAVGALKIMV